MKCKICQSNSLIKIIDLGQQKNTSIFPKVSELESVESYLIQLFFCQDCNLVQLAEIIPPDLMYKNGNYGYKSSISKTMRTHLKNYHDEIMTKKSLEPHDIVLDIGSNDATFLHFYSEEIRRLGIDPTGNQFKDYYDDLELLPDYFTKANYQQKFGNVKCKIITSICMFYDLPDPVQFAKDIHDILDDDGIWTCEQSYLVSMLKTKSIDTICHEHVEYYALKQIVLIAKMADLKIIDVKFNDSNGGSFRVYFCKSTSNEYEECTELISSILKVEDEYGLNDMNTYYSFMENCKIELQKLMDFIAIINDNNQNAFLYGASTKGNCVLQYCNITNKEVKYAVERNKNKFGCCTSTGIEIISEEQMRTERPDYLIVLPWHFKTEIIQREEEYLDNGGKLIFYFPEFEIVSNKPKTIITGCDGFIANYVKDAFYDHSLFGITRLHKQHEKNITKAIFDMNNYKQLEWFIKLINPDVVVHLASISSSIEAYNNPFKTLETNGLLCAKLCEILHNTNKHVKLFHASSSEMYKGHVQYKIDEHDAKTMNNMYHIHPYSIAKIMSHQIVKFYRKEYNLHYTNGIVFTTQAKSKGSKFLLNKVSNHIREWKHGKTDVLQVGNLDSYRNIIHPFDVASAIKTIVEQTDADDYLICNYNSDLMIDLVRQLYEKADIKLVRGSRPHVLYEKNTKKEVIQITPSQNGLDNTAINIQGYPCKLRSLDWTPKYSTDDILTLLLK